MSKESDYTPHVRQAMNLLQIFMGNWFHATLRTVSPWIISK